VVGTVDRKVKQVRAGWALGLILLLGLLVALQLTVGWRALLRPWREIPLMDLAGASLLLVGSYGIRTVRIHRYFAPDTSGRFLRSFRLVLVHNLFNNLLPMRTGEASFPVLMKRDFGVPFRRSLPALLYLRLLDLHYLLFLGAVVVLGPRGFWGWAAILLLATVPVLGYRIQGRLAREAAVGTGLFLTTWLWTAINWSVKLLVFAWILRAFLPMPYPTAILGSITGELSSVLPIHGVAGAGTYEAGVLAGLVPSGIEWEGALGAAVNLHLFVLGVSALCGVAAYPQSGGSRGS
jgi:uncharacterized membrane protein YbhN (UPF0104 family)